MKEEISSKGDPSRPSKHSPGRGAFKTAELIENVRSAAQAQGTKEIKKEFR